MVAILIDGKNALYRYGYAHRFLKNSKGQFTGALYGITGCLLRLKKKYPDARFVMVWDGADSRHNNWRKKIYNGYKANRTGEISPEVKNAFSQINAVNRFMDCVGIPRIEVKSIEADDVISVLALKCLEKRIRPIIYSSDCDFLQLVRFGVQVIRDTDKQDKLRIETAGDIKKRFRCSLEDVLKVRAIVGDDSDDIPGVKKGWGVVTAARLVSLGVDPALPNFLGHPKTVQLKADKIKPYWDDVHRNFRIMNLQTSELWHSQEFIYHVKRVLELIDSWKLFPDYDGLIKLLQEYELEEAMGDRHRLLVLQKISC